MTRAPHSDHPSSPPSSGPKGSAQFGEADIERSVSNRFERQVEKYSNRLAIKCAALSLTYSELNRRANRVAHAILTSRKKKLGPVALLLEQGIPAVATILGILKAGMFYLALDPAFPVEWLMSILEDANFPLIMTNNANFLSAITLGYDTGNIINIDEIDANLPDDNPGIEVSPAAFAYLYYTSGSTGQPKAIAQTHRHALHQVMTYTNRLGLCAQDRCTLLHSHTFSASRLDIFGPLLNGATVMPFSVGTEGMLRLPHWVREEEITIFHWVPSAFRNFLRSGANDAIFPSVRMVILGSEPVMPRDVELYRRYFPAACTLVNRFGTTETGNICFCLIDQHTKISTEAVPVGFVIEDVEVLLLDETGAEVEFGQVGEIAVRSPHFSGYWRQHEATRTGFFPDVASPGKTIYRSGDRGYMLPDGRLVHLGRNDLQVKVRGHRVELGRIEEALLEHPDVCEAAVIASGAPPDDIRLVGYVVARDRASMTSGALRRFLESRLPAHMVPGIFVQLSVLPKTPAGKLDRRSLPEPSLENRAVEDRYLAPTNALERSLAAVWVEVLAVPRVGIYDNFLDLGGHSLLANQIIARISEICDCQITPREFFEHPTVAQLADLLSKKTRAGFNDEELAGILADVESIPDTEAPGAVKKQVR
jgi:amino acid adenylation domain-containing protein